MDGQLGLGHTNNVRIPQLIGQLTNLNVRRVSAGRSHSAAWTIGASDLESTIATVPAHIPPQYTALQDTPKHLLHHRLLLLNNFSNLVYSSWRLLDLQPNQVSLSVNLISCLSVHLLA